ncbi:MAG: TerB family tellurite resistance protein [Polyangiaceae bacterium]|jgi:uncharacterized tellurite resistance protein B-like protein|nr:TerB family tellurite resistance protein [Polyangiaceae bacterium]
MELTKDVFVALAALAWVDGSVAPEEVDALLGAAAASGLMPDELDAVEDALRTPVPLERLEDLDLEGEDRLFIYGVGLWLVRADGIVTEDESEAVGRLAQVLQLSPEERTLASSMAAGLAGFELDEEDPRSVSSIARGLLDRP